MFPPGHGNDNLNIGDKFVISLFGTSLVFTAEGDKVRLTEYKVKDESQIWVCQMNSDYQIGMRNEHTGRFLGRWHFDQFLCCASVHQPWEGLNFTRLKLGGYSLRVNPQRGDKRWPIQRVNSSSPDLKIGKEITQFGLHQLQDSVFRRFEWVVPGRLARSSAPYYDGEDSDEAINETSIEFLVSHDIRNIISLNSIEISSREKGRLRAAEITYSHIKALEFTALTQEQFDQIWNAYDKTGTTIVYCGYGDGRTGMAISAIQLFEGRILSDLDYRANGVQCPSQIEALDALGERIHSAENPSDPLKTCDIKLEPPPYTASEKKTL
ncbi:hypothetical protein HOY80DRAFT_914110 [Tuber brumale]|nr:hypothetical protein HOY80DRAFT_914110 [Tuber brumale]